MQPDFAKRPCRHNGSFVFQNEVIEQIMDGLRRAGLPDLKSSHDRRLAACVIIGPKASSSRPAWRLRPTDGAARAGQDEYAMP
jgi:hypothetical protein